MYKTKFFIERSMIVHNDKYVYDKTIYVASNKKVIITCKKHGDFEQTPNHHLSGRGCSLCYGNNKKDNTSFILKAIEIHGNKYDYSNVEYVNVTCKIKIICPIHGVFEQKAGSHLEGKGCYKCAKLSNSKALKSNIKEFIKKSNKKHENKYDYSKTKYENNKINVKIICPIHGVFEQSPRNHLSGQGCPKCKSIISKPEIEVQEFVKSLGFEIETNNRKILNGKELDIYIPSLNKAIEFNGMWWHYSKEHFKKGKHSEKSNLCEGVGIKLLHIREDLWLKDKEKMKNVILKFLKPPK